MVSSVRRDDVVPGLRAAIESDDEFRIVAAHEVIDNRALSAIAEGKIYNENGMLTCCHDHSLLPPSMTTVLLSGRSRPSARAKRVRPAAFVLQFPAGLICTRGVMAPSFRPIVIAICS